MGMGSSSRLLPDTMSKIVYQQQARLNRLVTIEQIAEICRGAPKESSALSFGSSLLTDAIDTKSSSSSRSDDTDSKRVKASPVSTLFWSGSAPQSSSSSRRGDAFVVTHLNPHNLSSTTAGGSGSAPRSERKRGQRSRRGANKNQSTTTSSVENGTISSGTAAATDGDDAFGGIVDETDDSSTSTIAQSTTGRGGRSQRLTWKQQLEVARQSVNDNDDGHDAPNATWAPSITSLWPTTMPSTTSAFATTSSPASSSDTAPASWTNSSLSSSFASWSPSQSPPSTSGIAPTDQPFATYQPLFGSRASITHLSASTTSSPSSPWISQ
jgi:hypothetical protein